MSTNTQLEEVDPFTAAVSEFIPKSHITTDAYEIEAATGDLSILPKYHYKFKEEHRATHVIRPKNTEQLSKIMAKACEFSLPVTVRAAGTSCYSASSPTRGGVVIDVRRMNRVTNVDTEKLTVKCGAGISWIKLIEHLLPYGLAPKCYPTSYKSSCLSGFVVTSGTSGIGVLNNGSILDVLRSVTFVKPDGTVEEITKDSKGDLKLADIVGSFGIYGAVAEVEMSITPLKHSMESTGYGFKTIKQATDYFLAVKNGAVKPFFLSLSDKKFEMLSHKTIPSRPFFVYAVFYDDANVTSGALSFTAEKAKEFDALKVEDWYIKEKWRDISDTELSLGRLCNNPVFQEYWIADERVDAFYEQYAALIERVHYKNAFYMMAGTGGGNRIKLFGLSDIALPREFFGIKANFHKLAMSAYENSDRIYTVGVVNTFYFLMNEPEKVKEIEALKYKLDPEDRVNSYRFIKTKMRTWRIRFLFTIANFLYKMVNRMGH